MTLNKLRINTNEKGFTLIELMIVIAIIGILAAIAIPNFISYRDKTYCSAAESDTLSVMGAISDYFSNPANVTASAAGIQAAPTNFPATLSNGNAYTITAIGTNSYRVVTTDTTGRCPRFTTYGKTL